MNSLDRRESRLSSVRIFMGVRANEQRQTLFFFLFKMKAPVPSLSLLGWMTNPRESLDILVTQFFLTNASQTNSLYGKIPTAQSILQEFADDPVQAASQMMIQLNDLLRKYYDDSSVSVESRLRDQSKSTSVVEFTISGTVSDNGAIYQLNKIAQTKNGIFLKFLEINNG